MIHRTQLTLNPVIHDTINTCHLQPVLQGHNIQLFYAIKRYCSSETEKPHIV